MTLLELISMQHMGHVPVTVIEVKGGIDGSNYQQLQTEIQNSVEAGMRFLLLDFSQLTYMSSNGLRALNLTAKLLASKATASKANGDSFKSPYVKLLNPTKNIRDILEVIGFNMVFEIHPDRNEALASF